MKEKTKKIILIVVMIISVIGMFLTISHAKSNLTMNNNKVRTEKMIEDPSVEKTNEFHPNMQDNENFNMKEPPNGNFTSRDHRLELTIGYVIVICLFSGMLSISLTYLLMSFKNNEFYKNKDKVTIYVLTNIILILVITTGIVLFTNTFILSNTQITSEEAKKDETTLNKNNVVTNDIIDLDKEDTDVTITSGGVYTFTGKFTHSIIIDASNEEVEIILNGVEVDNDKTAAIIGLSAKKIMINLADGSENILNDGGNSEYDGCIFSNSELVFKGEGTLIVNGNQNEGEGIATEAKNITFNSGKYIITSNDDGINAGGDGATITINGGTFYIDASGDGIDSNKNAIINGGTIFVMGSDVGGDAGIDTDSGFEINGGFIIALGSDMIETPLETSNQKTIVFSLDKSISKDTIVTLMKEDEVIASFSSSKSFKTIIISKDNLEDGEYSLYTGGSNSGQLVNGIYTDGTYTKGEKIKVNNIDTFNISKTINLFGNKGR